MTLQQLFTLTTMEHRHLLLAYVLVAVVQLGYLVWTLCGLLGPAAAADAPEARHSSTSPRS